MRRFFRNEKIEAIDKQTTELLTQMQSAGINSEEYWQLMELLERLNEVKTKDRRNPLSWDTIAVIAGNLTGILLIVAYEQKHVLNSKALNQLIRPKTP